MSIITKFLLNNKQNLIINGSFLFDQRFVDTFTYSNAINQYVVDRWFYETDEVTTTSSTISRSNFTTGQTEVEGEPKKYLTWDHNSVSGDGTFIRKSQRIEYVSTLSGGKAGVSFWAKADSSINISINFRQHFGTGGSPSGDVTLTSQTISLTTSWARYQLLFDIPPISGKTLGVNNNDYLEFRISPPLNTSFVLDIANVNINEGIPSPFKLAGETEEEELLLCQRYFEKSYDLETAVGTITPVGNFQHNINGFTSSTYSSILSTNFKVHKKSIPSIIVYSSSTGNANRVEVNSGDVTPSGIVISEKNIIVTGADTSPTSIRSLKFQWEADAEL